MITPKQISFTQMRIKAPKVTPRTYTSGSGQIRATTKSK